MIQLKTQAEIAVMREAGLVVADTLAALVAAVAPGVTTGELDRISEESIRSRGAVPSFKGYHGFPATICTSINDEIVHGIPRADRVLRSGDVISLDCGAIVEGWHGDAAVTVGVGEITPERARLLEVCEESLWAGLAAARLGGRVSDISHAVESHVRPHGYGIIEGYGGHGIGSAMHQDPHVLNYGRPGRGPKLVTGLCLAIEPMITMGGKETRELADGWTVVSVDGSCAAHFEHTFTLTPDGRPWVLTAPDGGQAGLAPFGVLAATG